MRKTSTARFHFLNRNRRYRPNYGYDRRTIFDEQRSVDTSSTIVGVDDRRRFVDDSDPLFRSSIKRQRSVKTVYLTASPNIINCRNH